MSKIVATYTYTDEDGQLLYEVVRFHPKDFRVRRPDTNGDYTWDIKGVRRVLYRLPEILNANATDVVFVVEGEKDVDELANIGVLATTNPGGAGKFRAVDGSPLHDRRVCVIADRDEAGRDHAQDVAHRLHSKAAIVKVIELPEGKDACDWIKCLDARESEELRTALLNMFESAPAYVPLEESPVVPLSVAQPRGIPSEIFTGWLGDMIEAVSLATETPRMLPAMTGLGVLAATVQRIFEVRVKPDYFEPLCFWVCPAMESGNRKSEVLRKMLQPLVNWERDQLKELKPEIEKAEADRRTVEARLKKLRADAAKADANEEYKRLKEEIVTLERELPEVPIPPRLFAQDVTPEHLGTMLSRHNESMGIISDEGGIFDLMAGRYSTGIPNLDIFLQGHSRSPVRVDRGSRPPVILNNPTLTIALSPQPDVLQGLMAIKGFRGRGLLARFMFSLPESSLGYRKLDTNPVSEKVAVSYADGIRRLLEIEPESTKKGNQRPHALYFDDKAQEAWNNYALEIERDLRPGGKLEHLKDWGGKLPGAIARIAGLLHCADMPPDAAVHDRDLRLNFIRIQSETMERAIKLATILVEHTLAVFDLMDADPGLAAARKVWGWIERSRLEQFTARDCWHALRGTFSKAEEIQPAFDTLLDHGHISEDEPPEERKRDSRSRFFTVNPTLVAKWNHDPDGHVGHVGHRTTTHE